MKRFEPKQSLLVKNLIPILLCFCISSKYTAQNESTKWYFGAYAALDFMTNPPTILNNSAMDKFHSSSSIADSAGNLLFYTDGKTVWNKQHSIMANGSLSLSLGYNVAYSMIIKQPGNSNLYFIFRLFTSPCISTFPIPPPTTGLYYSVVDMSLAAGMGSVTVSDAFIYSVPFYLSSTAQLHGTRHANGTDYWIMIHEHPSNFKAYLFNSTGVNSTAINSNVGMPYQCDSRGYLKFSPTGQKLCVSVSYAGIELYDFNNSSGIVSNPLALISNTLEMNYRGCEFSADGTKLYAGHNMAGSTNSKLIQWDLSSGTNSAIVSSSIDIPSNSLDPNALQLAPNGKIYIASSGSQSLSVINNPNATGLACNFVLGGQPVSAAINASISSYSRYDLPYMITDQTNAPCVTQTLSNPQSVCAGNFYAIGNHTYSSSGTYLDTLQNVFACNGIVIVNTQLLVNAIPNMSVSYVSTICINDSINITASGANTYTWNSNLAGSQFTTPSFTTVGSVIYTVQLQGTGNVGCVSANTFSINVLVKPCDVGIEQNELQWYSANIKIFPNPTDGDMTVNFGQQASISKISIINSLGQTIHEDNNHVQKTELSVSTMGLNKGIYLIQFKTSAGTVTKQFVKD